MNQWVTYDSHFDQHEAKPRFCEAVLSYGVIQAGTHVDKLGRSTFAALSCLLALVFLHPTDVGGAVGPGQ
jgi:hypothetical protein